MPRMAVKPMYYLRDIYVAYARKLLLDNPSYKSRHAYSTPHGKIYKSESGVRVMVTTYPRFRDTMEQYFYRATRYIIQGEALELGSRLGKICVRRVERDFRKDTQLRIDWAKTRNQPLVWDEKKQKMTYKTKVYFTNDDWCRIGWNRTWQVRNVLFYEFKPTAANSGRTSGFKAALSEALNADPYLKFNYLFIPMQP